MAKKKVTTKSFIEKAHEFHGDKYDYSEVECKSTKEKVKIIFSKHVSFYQTSTDHLNKKHPWGKKTTTEEFI